jgi:hypothetical protein
MRSLTVRAIAAGASSGMAKHELTLISQRTYVSAPAASRSPYKKSASQITGKEASAIASISINCGIHSFSINLRNAWNCWESGPYMMRGPDCASGESGPSGGGGIKALIS